MLNPFMKKCMDINTPYCPCLLAETNHCTFCSKLQGSDCCNCNWQGVCVYYEKHWHDKFKSAQRAQRLTEECHVLRQWEVGHKTYLLEFKVSRELADGLRDPGSFVFLRRVSDDIFCHFPVGVMMVEDDKITVAIEAIGAKSSRFLLNSDVPIIIKGPYFNGVLGKPWIDNLKEGVVAVFAGGIGQAPVLPIIHQLIKNKNRIYFIAAPGKAGELFIRPYIDNLAITYFPVASLRIEGFDILSELLNESPDLLVSAGPDAQHGGIIRHIGELNVNLPMVATNNATMCCGEGICGSCEKFTQDGKQVKMCKMQLEYSQIIQE